MANAWTMTEQPATCDIIMVSFFKHKTSCERAFVSLNFCKVVKTSNLLTLFPKSTENQKPHFLKHCCWQHKKTIVT